MTGPGPALTVVVMGYRNQATIGEAVTSLLGQRAPEPFEVVVVTSGGDASAATVRATFPGLTVVESAERLLPGGARNAGVGVSRGAAVAFLAADCLAEPGWVAARLAAHRSGRPVVAGAMTSAPPHRPSGWASHFVLFCHRLPGRGPGVVAHPDAAAHGLSFDRSVLDRLGPFDADLRIGEDTEAARELMGLGIPVWFEPKVRTAHRGPHTLPALLRDHHRRGITSARAAAGGLRPTAPARALLGYPVAVAMVSRTTVAVAWRNGRGERLRLLVCLPWLGAAVAAGLAGRYRERLRAGRAPAAPTST